MEREIGIELLMTVAAFTAGGLGLWEEAAALAFLYSISEALEEFTEDRTRGAIRALMDLAPKRVNRVVDGREEEIDLDELRVVSDTQQGVLIVAYFPIIIVVEEGVLEYEHGVGTVNIR